MRTAVMEAARQKQQGWKQQRIEQLYGSCRDWNSMLQLDMDESKRLAAGLALRALGMERKIAEG